MKLRRIHRQKASAHRGGDSGCPRRRSYRPGRNSSGSSASNYPSDEDFRFLYGKQYGWALRFRIRGQLLTSLYPAVEGFTVQINLSPAAVEQAQQMNLGANVQGAIARATPYPEGRWLFIPVGPGG